MRANHPRSMVSNLKGEHAATRMDSLQSVAELSRGCIVAVSHDSALARKGALWLAGVGRSNIPASAFIMLTTGNRDVKEKLVFCSFFARQQSLVCVAVEP